MMGMGNRMIEFLDWIDERLDIGFEDVVDICQKRHAVDYLSNYCD